MPLKLPCPHCGASIRLENPYPRPGVAVACPACAQRLRVTYPAAIRERIEADDAWAPPAAETAAPPRKAPRPRPPAPPVDFGGRRPTRASGAGRVEAPTPPEATDPGADGPTPPARAPDPAPIRPAEPPDAAPPAAAAVPPATPQVPFAPAPPKPEDDLGGPTVVATAPPTVPATDPDAPPSSFEPEEAAGPPTGFDPTVPPEPPSSFRPEPPASGGPPPRRRTWLGFLARAALVLLVVGALGAAVGWKWLEATYATDLPDVETLRTYRPATVTTVLAADGETVLGEIYEQRRYVLPLARIPDVVEQAFVSAEDAGFWAHDGIDYMGIGRAMVRNLRAGRIAQGGSTITQQVAKNFLLTSERRLSRKIKEMFLSWRIEEAIGKEQVLFLYLNEIYLGSQAYGVDAACRTFFGHGIEEGPALHADDPETFLAKVSILAGLPPRPSEWNPHASFEASKRRQAYVLGQMVKNGHITQDEADAALAAEVTVVPRTNAFREQAPHFTEHVRRQLVEAYGEDAVLNQGLRAITTIELDLQQHAQAAVTDGVERVDRRTGFRRDAVEHLEGDAALTARADAIEQALREAEATAADAAGRAAVPERSTLTVGERYDAVVTEVDETWARLRIGAHEAIVPLAWSTWVYPPDPTKSWKYRKQDSFLRTYDFDEDGEEDGTILQRGDVVRVEVVALSTQQEAEGEREVAEAFEGTPGADAPLVAAELTQVPVVEGALLSLDVETGAITAMVGGADFERSQLNRTVQSRRQIGSTIKPIVYGAAIASGKMTTASIVADAPLAFATGAGELWKPSNYGSDYKGNITLRKALALSRNTCTIRVLDAVDPAMSRDTVYDFARALGLGQITASAVDLEVPGTPDTDQLCPWIEPLDPSASCTDKWTGPDGQVLCRACDLSMALGSVSLTMEELTRAYAIIARGGTWVQPYAIREVRDRDGQLLQSHAPAEAVQVVEPEIASLVTWLMENVVVSGTGFDAHRAFPRAALAGKTGTTNEEKDAWFVGFNPDIVTSVWVGYDQPASLGVSSTGGSTALPVWIDYMREALGDEPPRQFERFGSLEWVSIDEATGRRVTSGGREYPFVRGTAPASTGYSAGQASFEDLTTEL